jgi:dolichyl-phosphate beta-glucosyltransferase
MPKTAIIIPCYNEEKRIDHSALEALVDGCSADIYLANDGSTDATLEVIGRFAALHPGRCFVIHYEKNSGKANTIYNSVNELQSMAKYDYVGYFDADFSTPVSETIRLLDIAQTTDCQFVLGSRVLLLNSGIKRKLHRHIIGRIIITLINFKFKLKIYDTQCGAKVFSSQIIGKAFDVPFKTSWLFDVEIFVRLKRQDLLRTGREIPIYNWIDVEGSKLGWKTAFKILRELYTLDRNYSLKKQ